MKKLLILTALLVSPLLAVAGISINIGEPDYYGQLQIGNERPQLLFADPIIIHRGPGRYPPLYLRVPDYQARNWAAYCYRYNACGRPVYFVNDYWYRNTYAPRYRHHHHRDYHRDYDRRYDRHDNGHHYGHDKRHREERSNHRDHRPERSAPDNRGNHNQNRGNHDSRLNKFYDAR